MTHHCSELVLLTSSLRAAQGSSRSGGGRRGTSITRTTAALSSWRRPYRATSRLTHCRANSPRIQAWQGRYVRATGACDRYVRLGGARLDICGVCACKLGCWLQEWLLEWQTQTNISRGGAVRSHTVTYVIKTS